MKHLKFILPLVFILFSCSNDSNDSNQEANAILELNVFDSNNEQLSNVTVFLYDNLADYNNATNPVRELNTDFNGKVVFENLDTVTYYWSINSSCYATDGINFSTVNPLINNSVNSFSTNLLNIGSGSIQVVNGSAYDFTVSYTGPENGSTIVAANSSLSIENLDIGSYIFTCTKNGPSSIPLVVPARVNCEQSTLLSINSN